MIRRPQRSQLVRVSVSANPDHHFAEVLMAIIGMHTLMYARQEEATRRFFRDVLGFPAVDAGQGWLIFTMPPAELAIHPSEQGDAIELYLMCDDIEATVADLNRKGVVTRPIEDRAWGRVTQLKLPDGGELGMYEPRHPMAIAQHR